MGLTVFSWDALFQLMQSQDSLGSKGKIITGSFLSGLYGDITAVKSFRNLLL